MGYLRQVVKKLLTSLDISKAKPVEVDRWKELETKGFPIEEQKSFFQNQPYTPPLTFDIAGFLQMAEDRLTTTDQEIVFIQTDLDHVRNLLDEPLPKFPAENANENLDLADHYQRAIVMVPIRKRSMWALLLEELKALQQFELRALQQPDHNQFNPALPPRDALLNAIEASIAKFSYNLAREIQRLLVACVSPEPGCREIIGFKDSEIKGEDVLHDALLDVLDRREDPTWINTASQFRHLSDCMDNANLEYGKRIPFFAQGQLEELSELFQLLSAVRLQRPRNRQFLLEDFEHVVEPLLPETAADYEHDRGVVWLEGQQCEKEWEQVLERFRDIMWSTWPIKGKHDEKWLEEVTSSRDAHTSYWPALRKYFFAYWIEIEHYSTQQAISRLDVYKASERAPYLDEIAAERRSVEKKSNNKRSYMDAGFEEQYRPFTVGHESGAASKFVVPQTGKKVKTHGEALVIPPVAAPLGPVVEPLPEVKIKVNKNSLATFQAFWTEGAKGVKWKKFVEAMADAQFSIQPSRGSIYRFQQAGGKPILIHSPHPGSAFKPYQGHNVRKKLENELGWHKDMFEVRS